MIEVLNALGLMVSAVFALFWLYVVWITVREQPTDDPSELAFIWVVLSAGMIVCYRALL